MDFSRFDDIQNSFRATAYHWPAVHWYSVVNIRLFQVHVHHEILIFNPIYRSPYDDLGESIFTWFFFLLSSKSEFYGKFRISRRM